MDECVLPGTNIDSPIPKAHAWIVWVTDSDGKIYDLQVYERDPGNREKSRLTYERVNRVGRPYKDVGMVCSDWHERTLQDLLFQFGFQYGFVNDTIMCRSLVRLAIINEFREYLYTKMYQAGLTYLPDHV